MQYTAQESYSTCYGVDTMPDIPSRRDRANFISGGINRSMFRSLNDTRPPFIEIKLNFQSTEEEYDFRNAAVSGMKFYESEGKLFSAFLIMTVGNRVFAGYIKPSGINFFTIYKGIDPQWMHNYFCQALNILTINNDKDPGLYWAGQVTEKAKPIFESAYIQGAPMKVSNVAAFAHGRIFYATSNNLVYASNFIYSQGLSIEQREAVLSNTESEYPSSGDGFGAPSEMGSITGIVAVPQSDTLNGHGDVLVTCRNGVFSIAPNRKVRNEWTNDPEMQKNTLIGKGCVSHQSIASFANQLFYRDSRCGISSLLLDIATYQSKGDFRSISDAVIDYTNHDLNSPNIQFANTFVTNNRVISTIGHDKEKSKHMGIHRYANGMVSAVLQKRGDQQSIAWEGLWTGPRITGAVTSNIGNYQRTIVASYDTDNQNRLYYIDENSRSGDFIKGKYTSILGAFSYRGVFFDESPENGLVLKNLHKVEALLIKCNPEKIEMTYSTNGLMSQDNVDVQLTDFNGCGLASGRFVSDDVCAKHTGQKSGNSKQGYYFDINFYITGHVKIAKLVVGGNVPSANGWESGIACDTVKAQGITELCFNNSCDQRVNHFYYQF